MQFPTEIRNFDEVFLRNFANRFNLLRQEMSLIDLNIQTKGGTPIPAHKLVLCAQFPGIKKSILESKHSNLSNWSRFPYDIVMAAVDFAYTGEIIINVENVLGIYLMAHNLGCKQLIDWTTEFIKTRLDRLNLMDVWSAANVTSNTDLIAACTPRVACDFERLASNQPFLQHVGVDQLQTLLQSSWICDGKEILKFKAICTWLHACSLNDEHVKMEKHFRSLLKLIDMKKLPTEVVMKASVSGSDFNLSESARSTFMDTFMNLNETKKESSKSMICFHGRKDTPRSGVLEAISELSGGRNVSFPFEHRLGTCTVALDGWI
ncbi:unnamed protein product [Rodentolepis nana]|uniref:BTB domain-containing protein n=1 Tax=Rodentolepis nana TaxID=102285 RepID=A0A0R3TC15_RODNA|nr:unnamed protein product [Rodentolepis nana]